MSLLVQTPLALLGLLPWAAGGWWLLRGRAERRTVSWLPLWPRGSTLAGERRRLRPPAWPVVAMHLAAGLAIVAAAGPAWRPPAASATDATPERAAALDPDGAPRRPAPGRGDASPPDPVRVEAGIDPAIARIAEAYDAARVGASPAEAAAGASPGAARGASSLRTPGVIVAASPPPGDRPAVLVAGGGTPLEGEVWMAAHPVTRWLRLEGLRLVGATDPPPGWTPVLRVGGRVALAVDDAPVRRAWVGLDTALWAREPAFVVLWTNLLDWTSGRAAGAPVATTSSQPPNLRPDGVLRADGWLAALAAILAGAGFAGLLRRAAGAA